MAGERSLCTTDLQSPSHKVDVKVDGSGNPQTHAENRIQCYDTIWAVDRDAAGCGWGRAGRCVDPRRTPLNNASMRQHKAHRLRNRAPTRRRRPVVLLARAVTPAVRRCPPSRLAEPLWRVAASEIDLERLEPPPGAPSQVLDENQSSHGIRGSVKLRTECIHGDHGGPRENT